MPERRNPYFVLGLDYGASPQEAQAAFAKLSRRLRRETGAQHGIEDATWALHEIEHAATDPHARLGTYRVPANPAVYSYSAAPGVLNPPARNLPRQSGSSDADVLRLRAEVVGELGAAALTVLADELQPAARGGEPAATAAAEAEPGIEPAATVVAEAPPATARMRRSFAAAQLVVAVAGAVWVGVLSGWHLWIVLFVLAGAGIGAAAGADSAWPRGQRRHLWLLLLGVAVLGVGATGWLGGATGWHAGIVLMMWIGAGVTMAYTAVTADDLGKAVRVRLVTRLPVAVHVPIVLLAGGIVATMWIGDLSGWHTGVILTLWIGVMAASIATYAVAGSLTEKEPERTAGSTLLTGAIAAVLVLVGVAATAWIGGLTGWHAGILVAVWAGVAVTTLVTASVVVGPQEPTPEQPPAEEPTPDQPAVPEQAR